MRKPPGIPGFRANLEMAGELDSIRQITTLHIAQQTVNHSSPPTGPNIPVSLYTGIISTSSIETTPIAPDPNNPNIFYFEAKTAIYKSVNDMQNWTLIFNSTQANEISLAVAPSNSKVVYTGLDNGTVLKSANAGTTWSNLANMPNGVQAASIV